MCLVSLYRNHAPEVDLLKNICSFSFASHCELDVVDYPFDQMILERSLDQLM